MPSTAHTADCSNPVSLFIRSSLNATTISLVANRAAHSATMSEFHRCTTRIQVYKCICCDGQDTGKL